MKATRPSNIRGYHGNFSLHFFSLLLKHLLRREMRSFQTMLVPQRVPRACGERGSQDPFVEACSVPSTLWIVLLILIIILLWLQCPHPRLEPQTQEVYEKLTVVDGSGRKGYFRLCGEGYAEGERHIAYWNMIWCFLNSSIKLLQHKQKEAKLSSICPSCGAIWI